jgi:hypothetical protein
MCSRKLACRNKEVKAIQLREAIPAVPGSAIDRRSGTFSGARLSPWIGREYAGAQRMGIPATLREMLRQGLPFIVSKERMRMTGKSLRNRLRV